MQSPEPLTRPSERVGPRCWPEQRRLLNGVDNNEFGLGGVIVLPPPDAIQEFHTEEDSMSAEFGRGGAAVNVVLKSGTNQIHGGGYEFIRNDSQVVNAAR
jgi:hypothetical protein